VFEGLGRQWKLTRERASGPSGRIIHLRRPRGPESSDGVIELFCCQRIPVRSAMIAVCSIFPKEKTNFVSPGLCCLSSFPPGDSFPGLQQAPSGLHGSPWTSWGMWVFWHRPPGGNLLFWDCREPLHAGSAGERLSREAHLPLQKAASPEGGSTPANLRGVPRYPRGPPRPTRWVGKEGAPLAPVSGISEHMTHTGSRRRSMRHAPSGHMAILDSDAPCDYSRRDHRIPRK
jgi:hypothetical protein